MRHFRNKICMPTVFNRMIYETWEQLGKKDCFELARDKVLAILNEGHVNRLTDAVAERINKLL